MDDNTVLNRIHGLVDEEHKLRQQLSKGEISSDEEHARLKALEVDLDQCWDLLRRREALRAVGNNPDEARPAPITNSDWQLPLPIVRNPAVRERSALRVQSIRPSSGLRPPK